MYLTHALPRPAHGGLPSSVTCVDLIHKVGVHVDARVWAPVPSCPRAFPPLQPPSEKLWCFLLRPPESFCLIIFFFVVYFERDRERDRTGEGRERRERENPKPAPHC